jgi:hypothetical protein
MIRITIGTLAAALLCVSPAHADTCDAKTLNHQACSSTSVPAAPRNTVGPAPGAVPTYDKTWHDIIV